LTTAVAAPRSGRTCPFTSPEVSGAAGLAAREVVPAAGLSLPTTGAVLARAVAGPSAGGRLTEVSREAVLAVVVGALARPDRVVDAALAGAPLAVSAWPSARSVASEGAVAGWVLGR
jgi:hypothetical protein